MVKKVSQKKKSPLPDERGEVRADEDEEDDADQLDVGQDDILVLPGHRL